MNIDVVRESCMLPNMQRGDSLVLHPVGAYNVTQWMQFIEMRPAVVMIGLDKKIKLIRRKETVDDLNSVEG
jgi:diaminopimelate decarboxylase